MISVNKIYTTFLENNVCFFTGVPDSLLSDICAYITDHTSANKHIIAANEGTAIGIAAGHYMASGNIPVVYMQNSGLGNAVNPLLSLVDEKVYSLPLLLMIGWRGEPGVKDEPQHRKQGEITIELLEAMRIPYVILSDNEVDAIQEVEKTILSARSQSAPHAIIIRKGTFAKYTLQKHTKNEYPVSREDALKIVIDSLQTNDITVSTTGKLSRELFEYRKEKGQGHNKDFLTVGSMGHSSSIALGIALEKTSQEVYCLDGDGAFIMHMGGLSNIGKLSPINYRHILFNNGAHESVGGQPTAGFDLNIPQIALSCGYKYALTAITREEIIASLHNMQNISGPTLLEIKVKIDSRDDLGRPTTTPIENKKTFMEFLLHE